MKGRHEGMAPEDIDPVVDSRIERSIELLEEHISPTLVHYQRFLLEELAWIEWEKGSRFVRVTPLPG